MGWARELGEMKFDYYLLNSYAPEHDGDGPALYRKWIEQVQAAEELGYECAWFTEHHFYAMGGMLPNPSLLMAALAQCTTRIRLGTAVTILPFYNPVRVAEDVAMLDILSGGRVDVGLGRGMGAQYFDVFGVDEATSREKFAEQLAMIRMAWADDPFCWEGKYFQSPKPINVIPKPVQRPHPPLWIPAARDPAHAIEVGRDGLNLMTLPWFLPSFVPTREVVDAYRAGNGEPGRTAGQVMGYMSVYVGQTADLARRQAGPHWERARRISDEYRGRPEEHPLTYDIGVATGRAIFGDPEMCRTHVARVRDQIGLDRLALRFDFGGLPQECVLSSMRLFAQEVAPHFADD
jgi:alkanesulfonate monooxygenase SsuD/methylene tetrahydromethanopterin reductase-like flavin-dependent oxidoreductase (luciferase family)